MKQELIDKFYDSLDELIFNYLQNNHLGDENFRNSMDLTSSFPILSLIRLSKQNPDDPQIDISKIPQSSRDKLSVEIKNFRHLYSEMMSNVDISEDDVKKLQEVNKLLKQKNEEINSNKIISNPQALSAINALIAPLLFGGLVQNMSKYHLLHKHPFLQPVRKDYKVGSEKFTMIGVERGKFMMESKINQRAEKSVREVSLSSYWIGETVVTQGLWKAVMGITLRQQRDKYSTSEKPLPLSGEGDDYPMYYISWQDCQEFIAKLNEKTCANFRLPTEAEWKYAACGGGRQSDFQYSGSNDVDKVAWHNNNSKGKTHPVMKKDPNELGICYVR